MLLVKCKSANSQLNEYRKKWARICGEVSEFSTELNEVAEECEFNVQMFEVRGEGCTGGKYVEKMTNGKEVEDKTERKNM